MHPASAVAATLAVALLGGPALAQTPSAAGFLRGYGHPAVGPDSCRTLSPSQAQCVIPARTAGRYLINASGTSTATGAGAAQSLSVGGPAWVCIEAANRTPWSSGARTFHVQCAVTVLTDDPVAVNVIYRDTNAAMDPKGPTLAITAMPWTGILNAQPVGAK
jgi:hypothetical protein